MRLVGLTIDVLIACCFIWAAWIMARSEKR